MDNRVLQNVAPPQRSQQPFTQLQSIPHQQSTVVVPSQQFRAPIPQYVAGPPMNNALQSRMIEHHETNHSCQQPLAQGNSLSYPVPIPLHPAVIIPPPEYENPENCYQQIQIPQPVSNAPKSQAVPVTVETSCGYYVEYLPIQSSTSTTGIEQSQMVYSFQPPAGQMQPMPPQVFTAQATVYNPEFYGNTVYIQQLNPIHIPPQGSQSETYFSPPNAVEQQPEIVNMSNQTPLVTQHHSCAPPAYNPEIPPLSFSTTGNNTAPIKHTTTVHISAYSNTQAPNVLPQAVVPPYQSVNQLKPPACNTKQSSFTSPMALIPPQLEPALRPKREEYYKHLKTVRSTGKQPTRKSSHKPSEVLPKPEASQTPRSLSSSKMSAITVEPQSQGGTNKEESAPPVDRENITEGLTISESQNSETKRGKSPEDKLPPLLIQPDNQSCTIGEGEREYQEEAGIITDQDTSLNEKQPENQPNSTEKEPPNTPEILAPLPEKASSTPPKAEPETDSMGSSASQQQIEQRESSTGALAPSPPISGHSSKPQRSLERMEKMMLWVPDIDLGALPAISKHRQKMDMDPDMNILYLQHLYSHQLPRGRSSNDYLVQVQDNNNLHYNSSIPKYAERQQILASIAKYMDRSKEYKELKASQSEFTGVVKPAQGKRMAVYGGASSPDYFILLCISPFLPYTPSHNMPLSAQFLPGYCIPFSSTQSLVSAGRKNKEVRDVFGAEALTELTNNQIACIMGIFSILEETFQVKAKALISQSAGKQSDSDRESEVLLHSKFISHMALTALLYCQHEPSLENISQFISIIGYLLEHITESRRFSDKTNASYLELVRGLLTLLSHETAIEQLSSVMLGRIKGQALSASVQSSDSSRQEQQKEKLRKKLQAKKGKPLTPEDKLTRAGKFLTRKLQREVVEVLKYCCKRTDLTPYYLATLHAISALPLFSPRNTMTERGNHQEFINHLSGFTRCMIDNTQRRCHWNTDVTTSKKVMESVEAWHPILNRLLATIAGWQPGQGEKTTYLQWPSMALKKHKAEEQSLPPELLPLIEDSIRLKKETLKKKIDEDESIRQFEKDADRWAEKIDELNKKRSKQIPKPHKEQPARTSRSATSVEEPPEPNSEIPQEQKTEISTCLFVDKVANFCREMDFSKDFEMLRAEVAKHMDGELSFDSERLFLYTEMAFQCFHASRQRIAMTSTAMTAATNTHEKLTSALSRPKEEFVNRKQSSEWLANYFSPSELSPKKFLRLSMETTVEQLESARRALENALSLFQLAVKPGLDLLQAMEEPGFIFQGELALEELISHFEMCRDAMLLLTHEFKEPLNLPIITHELPDLKRKLFEELRLYGPNSFRRGAHSHPQDPSYEDAMAALKRMEDNKEEYQKYNQSVGSLVTTETTELMVRFILIDKGLKSFSGRATEATTTKHTTYGNG